MDLSRFLDKSAGAAEPTVRGHLRAVLGTAIQAVVPGARVGDLVSIECPNGYSVLAEIVGFREDSVNLLPLGPAGGLAADAPLTALQRPLEVVAGPAGLGRVLDGLGQPMDAGPPLSGDSFPVLAPAPHPLDRPIIERPISVGVRAIDGLLTLGEGQRVGLFAASGAGKSELLAQCARQTEADVAVIALVGERGREVREFVERTLGPEGLARSVVVVATSDAPALLRMKSLLVAITHAEAFRAAGKRVLLLVDSLTRFARAAREAGLSAGEPPVRRGYPASVFAGLPPLLERCGRTPYGSITALCTVLVEAEDLDDPIADELRGLLDGHIALSRELAGRGHFPAIDVLASLSRCMPQITDPEQVTDALCLRSHLARYRDKRDLVSLGAYQRGSDPAVDDTLSRMPSIEDFLRQPRDEHSPLADTRSRLARIIR